LEIFIKKITLFLGKNSSFLAIFYTLLWKTLQVGLTWRLWAEALGYGFFSKPNNAIIA
jgi:hypothetical protein